MIGVNSYCIQVLMRMTACLFLFLCSIFFSYSQRTDTAVFHLKATLTGIINKTNTANSYLSNNNVRFSILKGPSIFNSVYSWIYGKQLTGITNNDYYAGLDYNYYDSARVLSAWSYVGYDKSYSLKLNGRFQGGVGLGADLLESQYISLNISEGIIFEYNDYYQTADIQQNINQVYRNSLRIKSTIIIKKKIILNTTNFWQQSFSDKEDYILKSNSTLNLKLKKWLSLTVAVAYNKINLTGGETFLLNYGLTFDKIF